MWVSEFAKCCLSWGISFFFFLFYSFLVFSLGFVYLEIVSWCCCCGDLLLIVGKFWMDFVGVLFRLFWEILAFDCQRVFFKSTLCILLFFLRDFGIWLSESFEGTLWACGFWRDFAIWLWEIFEGVCKKKGGSGCCVAAAFAFSLLWGRNWVCFWLVDY